MNKEVYDWFNDGHKVLVCLDGDSAHLEVICPGTESGERLPGLKCGMGTETPESPESFCWVTEMMAEIGLEGHCTGIPIGVRDLMQIEWGYFGDGEEFWFKCAGYPSSMEIKLFREEAFAELFPGESFARATTVAKAIGMRIFKPWPEVDQEVKDQLREDINTYIEDEERKRNAREGE